MSDARRSLSLGAARNVKGAPATLPSATVVTQLGTSARVRRGLTASKGTLEPGPTTPPTWPSAICSPHSAARRHPRSRQLRLRRLGGKSEARGPGRCRIHRRGGGHLWRPDGLDLAALDLLDEDVLVGVLPAGIELDTPEEGVQVQR